MFLGIDIGGTTIKVTAFADLDNHTQIGNGSREVTGDYARDYPALLDLCGLMYAEHSEEYGVIDGIGLAIAGVLDKQRTTLARAGNTSQWVGQPFVEQLGVLHQCPVALGNDAEAAAMAEATYGNPDGDDFWFVIWGTGVGGTLVRYVDGRPVAFAGEMGHMRIHYSANSYECGCGRLGCLEAYCGGAMIRRHLRTPAEELDDDDWDWVLSRMAQGLQLVITSQPVGRVYFGGGIAAGQKHLLHELEDRVRQWEGLVPTPEFGLSVFGESAGTVGALALLKSVLV